MLLHLLRKTFLFKFNEASFQSFQIVFIILKNKNALYLNLTKISIELMHFNFGT